MRTEGASKEVSSLVVVSGHPIDIVSRATCSWRYHRATPVHRVSHSLKENIKLFDVCDLDNQGRSSRPANKVIGPLSSLIGRLPRVSRAPPTAAVHMRLPDSLPTTLRSTGSLPSPPWYVETYNCAGKCLLRGAQLDEVFATTTLSLLTSLVPTRSPALRHLYGSRIKRRELQILRRKAGCANC